MTDDTYLVRFPKSFPLSALCFAATRQGYRIKFVKPRDLRSRSLWEFIPEPGDITARTEPNRGEST